MNKNTHTDSVADLESPHRKSLDRFKTLFIKNTQDTTIEGQVGDKDTSLRRRKHSFRNLFARKAEVTASIGQDAEDIS